MERSTSLRRRLLLFYGYRGLVYFYLWLPVGAAYFTDYRGLSLAQYALIGTVGWLAMALAEVPTGAVADALGRRRSLALGAFLHGLGMLGQALTGDFAWLVAFGVVRTAGFAFISGTDHAWLYDSLKAEGEESRYTREAGRAAAVMHAAQGLASIVGAPLAVAHLAAPLIGTAAVSFVAASIALCLPEPPRAVPQAEGPASTRRPSAVQAFLGTVQVLTRRRDAGFAVAYGALVYVPAFLLFYVFLQPYAEALGVPLAWMGVLVIGLRALSMGGAALADRVRRGTGEAFALLGLPALIAAAGAFMVASRSTSGLAPLAAAVFAGALAQPLVATVLNRQTESDTRATVLSFASLAQNVLLAALQPLCGLLADALGAPRAMGMLCVTIGAAAVLLVAIWRPARHTAAQDPRPALAKTT